MFVVEAVFKIGTKWFCPRQKVTINFFCATIQAFALVCAVWTVDNAIRQCAQHDPIAIPLAQAMNCIRQVWYKQVGQ